MTEEFVETKRDLLAKNTKNFDSLDGYSCNILLFTMKLVEKKPKFHVLLIKRPADYIDGNPHVEEKWALPGGFVRKGESAYQASIRNLEEEIGLTDIPLSGFDVYDQLDRDPRGWIISRAYYSFLPREVLDESKTGKDVTGVKLVPVKEALNLPLALDHAQMLADTFKKMKREMLLSTKLSCCLPEWFTVEELYGMLEDCLGEESTILPPLKEFMQIVKMLPFLESRDDGKFRFMAEADAQSIFF